MLDAVKEEQGQELELLEALDDEQACGEESPSCAAEDAPLVFDVPAGKKPRLDAFLSSMCDESRSRLKKLVEQGRCAVDGQVCTDADQKVRPGQRVELRLPAASNVVEPEEGPLEILYRDADLAVVNKPAGLTMHPCPSCPKGTLVHRLLWHFPELARQEGPRPGVVHRLDKDTYGLVIVALSERARLRLIEDFSARRVHKTYLAVTRGIPAAEGTSDLPIGRHPTIKTRMAIVPEEKGGRTALTTWETLYSSPAAGFSLLSVLFCIIAPSKSSLELCGCLCATAIGLPIENKYLAFENATTGKNRIYRALIGLACVGAVFGAFSLLPFAFLELWGWKLVKYFSTVLTGVLLVPYLFKKLKI